MPLPSLGTLKKGKIIGHAEAATRILPEQAQVLQSANLGPEKGHNHTDTGSDRQGGYRYACSFKTNVPG